MVKRGYLFILFYLLCFVVFCCVLLFFCVFFFLCFFFFVFLIRTDPSMFLVNDVETE